jgi:hypothetical protein
MTDMNGDECYPNHDQRGWKSEDVNKANETSWIRTRIRMRVNIPSGRGIEIGYHTIPVSV